VGCPDVRGLVRGERGSHGAMKHYLVFSGVHYYPSGGWKDFDMAFDNLEAAVKLAKEKSPVRTRDQWAMNGLSHFVNYTDDWSQVVDIERGLVVWDNWENRDKLDPQFEGNC
jgi:hypothetical protein